MLNSEVSWLADGYRSKADKAETKAAKTDHASSDPHVGKPAQQRKYPQPLLTSGRSLVRKSWSARQRPPKVVNGAPNQTRPPITRARSAPSGSIRSRLRPGSGVPKVSDGCDVPGMPEAMANPKPVSGLLAHATTGGSPASTCGENTERPFSAQPSALQSAIDMYTQPLASRSVKNAAFRLYIYHTPSSKDGLTPSEVLSPASRPCSGRMRVARSAAARPLGKPRSAWEAEHEADDDLWYPLNITHPSPAESETNLADLNLPPFHTTADSDKMTMQHNPRRPYSSLSDRPGGQRSGEGQGHQATKRPVSSCDARNRRQERGMAMEAAGRPRSTSAGPTKTFTTPASAASSRRRALSPACHYSPVPMPGEEDRWDDGYVEGGEGGELRPISPWLEDPRIGLSVGFEHDPRLLYMDQRHARCLSHTGHSHVSATPSSSTQPHGHSPLIMWQTPGSGTHSIGENRSVSGSINNPASSSGGATSKSARRPWSSSGASSRPWSSSGGRSRPCSGRAGRYYSSKQRYVDVHRPQTAPSTRKELQNYGATAQRGYLPHYCNFVRSVNLHTRPNTSSSSNNNNSNIIVTVDDNTDDGYNTNTDMSHPDTDQDKCQSVKSAPPPLTGPSLTTRANSPSSTGYDPESLLERLQEQGLAGSLNNLNSTGNGSDVGEDLDLDDDDFRVEEEPEDGNSREITTQTPVQGVRVTVSPAPGPRLPIQIPGTDEKLKEAELIDSARSKEDVNASGPAEQMTPSKNKEPVRKPPATPSSGSKGKGRSPCVKKEKTFTKEKKKKGKKKEEVDKQALSGDDQKTQVQKQTDDIAPEPEVVPAEPISVEAQKAPDLPTLDVPDGGAVSKGKKKKSGRKLMSATKPVEKAKTNPVKEEPTTSFYDFGDLETTKAQLEDVAAASRAAKVPSYLNDRMVLSLQSSRFELPMDMKSLEKMSPADYLRKYCVISTRRKTLYQKIFQKHRERAGHILGKTTLSKALQEVLVNALKAHQVTELCDILEIEDATCVDLQLFSGMAALAERILYPDHLTEDTAECTDYHREKVECADFCSLQWKLHGVQISPPVKKILQALG